MDYLHAAFGTFEPQIDSQAALKFSLNVALMDGRLDELAMLLVPNGRVSGVGGEPGWEIERIDPEAQHFVARVDRHSYSLAHDEARCDRAELWRLLRPMLLAYATEHPHDRARIETLLAQAPPA